jgi:hypothetical protein
VRCLALRSFYSRADNQATCILEGHMAAHWTSSHVGHGGGESGGVAVASEKGDAPRRYHDYGRAANLDAVEELGQHPWQSTAWKWRALVHPVDHQGDDGLQEKHDRLDKPQNLADTPEWRLPESRRSRMAKVRSIGALFIAVMLGCAAGQVITAMPVPQARARTTTQKW